MKATLPVAAVFFAGTLALSATTASAGTKVHWTQRVGALLSGQAAPGEQERDPAVLLKAARQSMAQGQLVEAEAYLERAESHWGAIHLNMFADSPSKVRRDLNKLKAGGPPVRPSQQSTPSLISAGGGSKDTQRPDPFQRPGADVDAMILDRKPQAIDLVHKGREALLQGNLPSAIYFERMAAEQGAAFGANEDSPARLADEIRRRGGNPDGGAAPAPPFATTMPGEEAPSGGPPLPLGGDDPVPRELSGLQSLNRRGEIRPLPDRPDAPPAAQDPTEIATAAAGNGNAIALRGPGNPAPAKGPNGRPSDALLLQARRALAGGDTRRTLGLIAQVRALGDTYGPLDDSPTKIEALVRRYDELMEQRATGVDSDATNRTYALLLMEQAEGLIRWQDYEAAEHLASDARQLQVDFAPFENNPTALLRRITVLRQQRRGVAAAEERPAAGLGGQGDGPGNLAQHPKTQLFNGQVAAISNQAPDEDPAGHGPGAPAGGVAPAVYEPLHDQSRVLQAGSEEGPSVPPSPEEVAAPLNSQPAASPPTRGGEQDAGAQGSRGGAISEAADCVRLGDEALARKDQKTAMEYYVRAAAHRDQLDPATAQHLQNCLQLAQATLSMPTENTRLLEETSDAQQRLKQQVTADVARQTRKAMDAREQDPRGAVDQLKKTRTMVEESRLTGEEKKLLLIRIDRVLSETQRYVDQHRSEIELSQQNHAVRKDVEQGRVKQVQVQQQLALLVDEYNRLRDERRFHEAEVKAKQAREIAPDEPVVVQMWHEIHFIDRVTKNRDLKDDKENNFWSRMYEVDVASNANVGDESPERFMDKPDWEKLTRNRLRYGKDAEEKRSPKEIEIEQKLRTPVSLSFRETPLSEVVEYLKRVTAVNIYVDPQGLAQEGVHVSTPISIELNQDISLQSALNLILQPLHLGYVIKDEVLKITSEQVHSGNLRVKVYNVADLVIPIPDFSPTSKMGLPQLLQDGYRMTNSTLSSGGMFQPPVMDVASHQVPTRNGLSPESVLAQQTSGSTASPGSVRAGSSSADFDGLIDLITKTIDPSSWDEVGGPGSIKPAAGNLSLVVSQTQEVHEKIADLLDQLRRLQDLQVTIEVRFITLSDNFFERIGVDFDFNIRDNATAATVAQAQSGAKVSPSATIGLQLPTTTNPFPNFTANGEIPYAGNIFNASTPSFGGFDPTNAATFGIAILSDIEAYFVVQAAQGDLRSNIMQAPKVTLFNGQAASISDQVQTPFVTSVTPVVGNFAAAQAPVIVVLNAGTTLSVQAVVSPDRRFVRLTLVPFFSQIGDVSTFTFTGTTTTNSSNAASSANSGDTTSNSDTSQVVQEGTTVQLPQFIFTTVTTTVSVPDGGTVLLGGVKRLKEGRNELGVPILSKIPYIDRLFRNVGIGREAESLMLMVTPRIIIQEEEEQKIGSPPPESS